jgi:CRP/FNR family cyclic AMP-dependent transcriptional regulator
VGGVDPDVRGALDVSRLRGLPEATSEALLRGAARERLEAGAVTHREGERGAHLDLVLHGVLRISVAAPDGRTATVRYCRRGALIGVMSLFQRDFVMPATAQAVGPAEIVRLSAGGAARLAGDDIWVARAFATELADRVAGFVREIPDAAFATVRHRLARHLLDLSRPGPVGPDGLPRTVVSVTQRDLAEAIGTSREVVVRELRGLRSAGLVSTRRGRIELLDPSRLLEEREWNPGS